MFGGMAFRKDCEDCGRSFLTSDRRAKFCPSCTGKGRKRDLPGKTRPSKTALAAKLSDQSSRTPDGQSVSLDSKKFEIPSERRNTATKSNSITEGSSKPGYDQTPEDLEAETKSEVVLTEEQTKEIIDRYQRYVEVMERPPGGRRKTIAAEMGLPYHAVVMALRTWNQAREKDLSREERFSLEKTYFSFPGKETSFDRLKERICRETGLNPWSVSRYLDILHDGEDKLKSVEDVSPEQKTAILAEYNNYLAGSAPPEPFLHPMIAEKIGIKVKQVHKVLLAYRLCRFREME
jgi:hypothetical protein